VLRYTLKRLVNAFVILFIITTVSWLLMQFLPGSPFNDEKLTDEAKAQLEAKYGLDDPLLVQYVRYIGNVAQGDLGNSYAYNGTPVVDIVLGKRLAVSAFLGTQALIAGTLVGILLGSIAAMRHDTFWDKFSATLSVLGVSVPTFVLAPLLQYWLAFKAGIFPIALFESWWHSVLPSAVLAIAVGAVVATYTRAEMLEVFGQDYVTLAKAKGLSRVAVVIRHVLRNSMIPLVTILVPLAAALLTGTLVVETVFSIPGIGEQFVRSVFVNDYSVIMGTTLLFAVFFVASYLIQDILYGIIDPRIRVAGTRE
jgi:oligopeptide transport system permease protein